MFKNIFIFFNKGGYTVVLSSTGSAAKQQPACLGVYRMVGEYNNKPLYKQDDGENFLYYQNKTWQVGPHLETGSDLPGPYSDSQLSYAWMKRDGGHSDGASSSDNSSSDSELEDQGGAAKLRDIKFKSKALRKSKGLFKEGWKYKPSLMNVKLSETLDDSDNEIQWMEDDVTLKVEALKGG